MTPQILIEAIDRHCKATGLAPATVCRQAVGNNRLYRNLEAGRTCTIDVANRLLAHLAEAQSNQEAAP